MMNKFIFAAAVCLGLGASCAYSTENQVSYEHSYGTMNRYHNDTFSVFSYTDSGLYLGGSVYFYNAQKDVIDDWLTHSESIFTGYSYALTDQWHVIPNLEAKFYTGSSSGQGYTGDIGETETAGSRYTPGLKLTYQADADWLLMTQYRFDVRKISRAKRTDDDPDTHRQRFDIGVVYSGLNALTISYTVSYHQGNYVMYDNKKHDYKQDLSVGYHFADSWIANVGAEDVAYSTESSSREAKLKAGITYTF
jgi:hypothetical protein